MKRREAPFWRRYLRLFGPDLEADIDEELEHHLELLAARYRARGLSAQEARSQAEEKFGNRSAVRADCARVAERRRKTMARAERLDRLIQDVRFAVRTFVRTPAFTIAALLTLGLGIGANTAVFSVVNAALLRPLPFRNSEDVIAVWTRYVPESGADFEYITVSIPEYRDYQKATRNFSDIMAYRVERVNIAGGEGPPDRVQTTAATGNFFKVVGVQPALGRGFHAGEDAPGAPCVVVLTDDMWRTRYGGSPDVLQQTVRLDGAPCAIVGVMPRGFFFPIPDTKIIRPFALDQMPELAADRESHWILAAGRLAEGATLQDAEAELAPLMESWRKADKHHIGHFIVLQPFREMLVGDERRVLILVLAAAGLVLLIICANLANLLLARSEARRREVAVRVALGAGRGRLIRQLLTESLLLAATGGLLALAIGPGLLRLLIAVDPDAMPQVGPIGFDGNVLAFTVAVSIVTGVLFGLVPAFQVSTLQLHDVLKNRTLTATGRSLGVRRALVVLEVSLSLAIVVAAGLLVRSYQRMQDTRLGFERDNVLTLDVSLPAGGYSDKARVQQFYDGVGAQVAALPGVDNVGFISTLPLASSPPADDFMIEGRPEPGPDELDINGGYIMTTPGALEALGVPLLRGRLIDARDVSGAPLIAVIDETAARTFWPGLDPIGRRIRYYDDNAPWLTIIGVVGAVHYVSARQAPRPNVYVSHAQRARPFYTGRDLTMLVRSRSAEAQLAPTIRRIVKQTDALVPVTRVRAMEEVVTGANIRARFAAALMSLFGLVALAVGALGLYGVLSYLVQTRTNEIGIRMALGADARHVLRQIMQQGLALAGIGIVLGSAVALAATRLLSTLLFGVSGTDALTYAVVIAVLGGTTLLASWLPARRATRVDPLTALRS